MKEYKKTAPWSDESSEEIQDMLIDFFEVNNILPVRAVSEMLKMSLRICSESHMEVDEVDRLLKLLLVAYKNKELD